jgi:hypothetical protein
MWAAAYGHLEVVKVLVQAGADWEKQDKVSVGVHDRSPFQSGLNYCVAWRLDEGFNCNCYTSSCW